MVSAGALVESVEGSGLAVALRVEGVPQPLASGVDLAAYRVAQEALTNSLRHADAAHVDVVVRYGDASVELEVADDGRGGLHAGVGHGPEGMRERVRIYGGDLQVEEGPKGGVTVRARLPLS